MKRAISKQVFGERSYRDEQRVLGFENAENEKLFVVRSFMDRGRIEGVISANIAGAPYAKLGDVPDMLVGAAKDLAAFQTWRFSKIGKTYHWTNVGNHAITLQVWEYVAQQDRPYGDTVVSTAQQFAEDMYAGKIAQTSGATDGTATKTEGLANFSSPISNQISSISMSSAPGSKLLNAQWKQLKYRKVKLNPGDEVIYNLKKGQYTYDPAKHVVVNADSTTKVPDQIFAGCTKCLVFAFCGPLGRSDDVGEHGTVGRMQTHIGLEETYKTKLLPMWGNKRYRHMETHHDDLALEDLVAPEDVDMDTPAP